MSEEVSQVMSTISRIYDNMWIGDIASALAIAEKASKGGSRNRLVKIADDVKNIMSSERKIAREEGVKEDIEEWITDRFLERTANIPIDEAMQGVIVVHLSNLKKFLNRLVQDEMKRQWLKEPGLLPNIKEGKGYRYVIVSQPDRFEVRALVDIPFHKVDYTELEAKLLEEFGLSVGKPERSTATTVFRFFSNDEFIELKSQHRLVRIIVAMKERSIERAEKISQRIIELLV